jgi:hypothetical protein
VLTGDDVEVWSGGQLPLRNHRASQ